MSWARPGCCPRGERPYRGPRWRPYLSWHGCASPRANCTSPRTGIARTALEDLLALPAPLVNDDRLYRALDKLLPHKRALEQHLVARLGEYFALDYDLLLYDVTSTYFEGLAARNPLAQRGHSRDHRPDCKQVCVALVVTREGMPLGYVLSAGNRARRDHGTGDVKTRWRPAMAWPSASGSWIAG